MRKKNHYHLVSTPQWTGLAYPILSLPYPRHYIDKQRNHTYFSTEKGKSYLTLNNKPQ